MTWLDEVVLAVDAPAERTQLRDVLEPEGVDVTAFSDPVEAVHSIDPRNPPDFVLIDVSEDGAGGRGVKAGTALTKIAPWILKLAVWEQTHPQLSKLAVEVGFDGYIRPSSFGEYVDLELDHIESLRADDLTATFIHPTDRVTTTPYGAVTYDEGADRVRVDQRVAPDWIANEGVEIVVSDRVENVETAYTVGRVTEDDTEFVLEPAREPQEVSQS